MYNSNKRDNSLGEIIKKETNDSNSKQQQQQELQVRVNNRIGKLKKEIEDLNSKEENGTITEQEKYKLEEMRETLSIIKFQKKTIEKVETLYIIELQKKKIEELKIISPPIGHLKKLGIPKLVFVRISTTEPSSHKECEVILSKFENLNDPYCKEIDLPYVSKLWLNLIDINTKEQRPISISNESGVKDYFNLLLEDIITLCGFKGELEINMEVGITNLTTDFILVSKNGVPKGVVEIKRPSDGKSNSSNKINGQIYDYMKLVQNTHNLKQVFGIVSSYINTEILWLYEDTMVVEKDIRNIINNTCKNKQRFIQSSCAPIKLSKTIIEKQYNKETNITEEKRKVFKSNVYHQDDANIVQTLCSVIQKMYYTPNAEETGSCSRDYISLNHKTWFWVTLDRDICPNYSCLTDFNNVTEGCDRFKDPLLLEDLGSGGDGKCWLAFNIFSDLFVIKFFKKVKNAGKEKKIWMDIWGIETMVTTLNEQESLMMPYFKILTESDWKDEEILKLVKRSCLFFAEKNYCHLDLFKRHVAKYNRIKDNKQETVIVFIDLSRVERISETEIIEKGNQMYNQLINDEYQLPYY